MSAPGSESRDDAGVPLHHWLLAIAVGAVFGAIGVLVNWVVLRALT